MRKKFRASPWFQSPLLHCPPLVHILHAHNFRSGRRGGGGGGLGEGERGESQHSPSSPRVQLTCIIFGFDNMQTTVVIEVMYPSN